MQSLSREPRDCSVPFYNIESCGQKTLQLIKDLAPESEAPINSSSNLYVLLKFPSILSEGEELSGSRHFAESLARKPKRGRQKRKVDECDSDGEPAAAKRNSSYVKNPFPALLKSDPRRHFAQMYLNVLNSGDPQLFVQFMRQFFMRDAQYQRFMHRGGQLIHSSDIPLIEGRDLIMLFLLSHLGTAPDMVTLWREGSIRRRVESERSEVCVDVSMAGTRLFMIDMAQLNDLIEHYNLRALNPEQQQIFVHRLMGRSIMGEEGRGLTGTRLSDAQITEVAVLSMTEAMSRDMLLTPSRFVLEGRFTLYLDEECRVYRLDFERSKLSVEEAPELNPFFSRLCDMDASGETAPAPPADLSAPPLSSMSEESPVTGSFSGQSSPSVSSPSVSSVRSGDI